jgi:hypothetical protein
MKFGEELNIACFAVKGKISKADVLNYSDAIIKLIGMTPMPGSLICSYPFDQKGGNGLTFFQSLTESFLAWDIWDDFAGSYLFIASCKPFVPKKVMDKLKEFGLDVHQKKIMKLSLED